MRYVNQTLGADEEILRGAAFHWIHTFSAVFQLFPFAFFALLVAAGGHSGAATAIMGVSIFIFFYLMIVKWTTEIAVTNKRLIYKRGWVLRKTDEIGVGKLEEVNLSQGILGRMLGYGRLKIGGTGVGSVSLPTIADPVSFRRAIMAAQEPSSVAH